MTVYSRYQVVVILKHENNSLKYLCGQFEYQGLYSSLCGAQHSDIQISVSFLFLPNPKDSYAVSQPNIITLFPGSCHAYSPTLMTQFIPIFFPEFSTVTQMLHLALTKRLFFLSRTYLSWEILNVPLKNSKKSVLFPNRLLLNRSVCFFLYISSYMLQ